jgi:hypothetical protein
MEGLAHSAAEQLAILSNTVRVSTILERKPIPKKIDVVQVLYGQSSTHYQRLSCLLNES